MKAACRCTTIALVTALAAQPCRAAETLVPAEAYLKPHQLVDIDAGRRLNLFCLGSGKPTVVLESGLGSTLSDWRQVQAEIAKFTEVCGYERAGYGFSDPTPRPSDVRNAVDDLHRLVIAAKIGTPFVLVGHSLGGLYAASYAAAYPSDVAGMLLIDPSFVGSVSQMAAIWTPAEKALAKAQLASGNDILGKCLNLAEQGALTKPENQKSDCIDNPPNADPVLHRALNAEYARPGIFAAVLAETQSVFGPRFEATTNDAEAREKPLNFDDKPLIVLSASAEPPDPTTPKAESDRQDAVINAGHKALAARSRRGIDIVVPKAGHFIQKDQPAVVIQSVRQIVEEIRSKH